MHALCHSAGVMSRWPLYTHCNMLFILHRQDLHLKEVSAQSNVQLP